MKIRYLTSLAQYTTIAVARNDMGSDIDGDIKDHLNRYAKGSRLCARLLAISLSFLSLLLP